MSSTIILSDNGASSGSAGLKSTAGNDGVLILQTTTSGGTATNAVYIDTSQNVGIGTSSPSTMLQLNGSAAAGKDPTITLNNTTASTGRNYQIISGDGGPFRIQDATAGAERMRIDSSGNVGIGTNSPSQKLDVTGNIISSQSVTIGTGGLYQAGSIYSDSSWGMLFRAKQASPASADFRWANSADTERMRIDTSGNLLVGTTNSLGKIAASGTGTLLFLDGNVAGADAVMRFGNQGTQKSLIYWSGSNDRTYIATGGSGGVYLANGGTSWTSASDERVKDIIEPIENATQTLSGWRTVIGKYKTDEEGVRRSFLIAQDVLATFPEAVDATNEDEYGVRYQDTIPVLVKAIQELKADLDATKAELAALKAK